MQTQESCIESYRQLKNLKLVGAELGIPWQTVYVHLRAAGEPVTGDKARYGSDKDRLAARGERLFLRLVPYARDRNDQKYQDKIDFTVRGHGVDVKTGTPRPSNKHSKLRRWAFGIKKQEAIADFFVCVCMDTEGAELRQILLIPGEIARKYMTISLSESGGKWSDYAIKPEDLEPFFASLPIKH
jgi:hypothetical protein